jgi:hypothetical protein
MGDTDPAGLALRVEHGTATGEELAALTVVLLARRCRRPVENAQPRRADAPRWWQRPGQYLGSRSWQ